MVYHQVVISGIGSTCSQQHCRDCKWHTQQYAACPANKDRYSQRLSKYELTMQFVRFNTNNRLDCIWICYVPTWGSRKNIFKKDNDVYWCYVDVETNMDKSKEFMWNLRFRPDQIEFYWVDTTVDRNVSSMVTLQETVRVVHNNKDLALHHEHLIHMNQRWAVSDSSARNTGFLCPLTYCIGHNSLHYIASFPLQPFSLFHDHHYYPVNAQAICIMYGHARLPNPCIITHLLLFQYNLYNIGLISLNYTNCYGIAWTDCG